MSAFLVVAIVLIIVLLLLPEIELYVDESKHTQHPKNVKNPADPKILQHPQHPQEPHHPDHPQHHRHRVNPDPLNNYIIIPDTPYPMLAKNAYLPSYQNMPLPIDNRSQQEAATCNPALPHTCRVDGVAVGVQGRIF